MSANKIRMRLNKNPDAVCKVCNGTRKNSIEFFDIAFTDKHIITICDVCNNQLFRKTLKASCSIDEKLKDKHDIAVISNNPKRYSKRFV